MAGGWWNGVGRAIEIVGALAGAGRQRPRDHGDYADPASPGRDLPSPGGLLGGIEARLAGVLVSALHEAFARDAARMDAEREQAAAERERAERALRLEMARQEAERQLGQLRALVVIDVVVWLASLVAVLLHPPGGIAAKLLLGASWVALTAGIAAAFLAYGRVSETAHAALALEHRSLQARPPILAAASWLTVGGFGLAAASVIALMA